jgi:NTE family protein
MAETSNAFVLSGGGILGTFQAGAISAMLKQKQFTPSGIFGSSDGALNGAFLADRAGRQMASTGRIDWARVADDLVKFWRSRITGPDDFRA